MNIRFYLRFLVPFLLLQLISSITHCASTSTGNGEKGKIKNTATGRGGEGAQKIKPNNKSHGFHKMNETPSPAISPDLEGKMRNHRKTSPNVAHNQAIETKKVKEHRLVSSNNCSVSIKKYCCKRVCQKRRPQQAQFPHNSGAHHQPSNNHHSSMIRVQRQADICATCLATMDDEGNCSCPAEAWQEPEPEVVEQPPPPVVESDSLPEQVVPDYYAGDAVVPDS